MYKGVIFDSYVRFPGGIIFGLAAAGISAPTFESNFDLVQKIGERSARITWRRKSWISPTKSWILPTICGFHLPFYGILPATCCMCGFHHQSTGTELGASTRGWSKWTVFLFGDGAGNQHPSIPRFRQSPSCGLKVGSAKSRGRLWADWSSPSLIFIDPIPS